MVGPSTEFCEDPLPDSPLSPVFGNILTVRTHAPSDQSPLSSTEYKKIFEHSLCGVRPLNIIYNQKRRYSLCQSPATPEKDRKDTPQGEEGESEDDPMEDEERDPPGDKARYPPGGDNRDQPFDEERDSAADEGCDIPVDEERDLAVDKECDLPVDVEHD